MESLRKCGFCKGNFLPEKKNRHHQIYCSPTCRRLAKKERDKRYKRVYRKTMKYRSSRQDQNRRYREKKGWEEYIRQYRGNHPEKVIAQDQKASREYYRKNRRKIALKRSELRWQKKLRAEIEALKKAAP